MGCCSDYITKCLLNLPVYRDFKCVINFQLNFWKLYFSIILWFLRTVCNFMLNTLIIKAHLKIFLTIIIVEFTWSGSRCINLQSKSSQQIFWKKKCIVFESMTIFLFFLLDIKDILEISVIENWVLLCRWYLLFYWIFPFNDQCCIDQFIEKKIENHEQN